MFRDSRKCYLGLPCPHKPPTLLPPYLGLTPLFCFSPPHTTALPSHLCLLKARSESEQTNWFSVTVALLFR